MTLAELMVEARQRERKYERPWYRDIERKSLTDIKKIVRDIRRRFKNPPKAR